MTEAGAVIADDIGLDRVSMGLVAEHFGVKSPSLYKHVDNLSDLLHRIAVLGAVELSDAIRDATQGRSGRDAMRAAAHALRIYVRQHPGRYAASHRVLAAGPGDSLTIARDRLLDSFAAVLRGYGLDDADRIHALRMVRSMVHGFAMLDAAGEFQMDTDIDDSFGWMLDFIDHGLRATLP